MGIHVYRDTDDQKTADDNHTNEPDQVPSGLEYHFELAFILQLDCLSAFESVQRSYGSPDRTV